MVQILHCHERVILSPAASPPVDRGDGAFDCERIAQLAVDRIGPPLESVERGGPAVVRRSHAVMAGQRPPAVAPQASRLVRNSDCGSDSADLSDRTGVGYRFGSRRVARDDRRVPNARYDRACVRLARAATGQAAAGSHRDPDSRSQGGQTAGQSDSGYFALRHRAGQFWKTWSPGFEPGRNLPAS